MNYHLITFGCQFNKSDAERMATVLGKLGYKEATKFEEADLILVLACSVRQSAIDRVYGLKKKFQKLTERKPIVTVLSGCLLEKDKKKMAEFFDIVLPITDLAKLARDVTPNLSRGLLITTKRLLPPTLCRGRNDGQVVDYFKIHPRYYSNFSAYVPIMTGCNNFCAYCVVPYVRGREICRQPQEIIKECQNLIKKGYKEITLIGQNVNSYQNKVQSSKLKVQGDEEEIINFPKLLKMIDEIPGDYWLRFLTSHPKDLSDELIKVMAKGKHLTPYLHLPVQAGDNQILKKMNRGYTVEYYKNLIKNIRQAIPEVAISTDVIVGFPGETKKQFENTVRLFRKIKFDMAYIAQYSERSGTAAAKLKDNVPKLEKKRREKVLTEILKEIALANNQKLLDKEVEVLVESWKKGFCFGKTAGFKTIKFSGPKNLIGKFVKVKIIGANFWGLRGEIVR